LAQLIDQILKSVVTEQGVKLNLTKVNINILLNHLIQDYKPQIMTANAKVSFVPPNNTLFAMADGQLLKNAIANLLDNALKYGGHSAEIGISLIAENNNIQLSVKDNGAGIPRQYQDKIFDRFFRVPSGDVHNIKGYGLGLSHAKSIVEQHNGTIFMVDHENQGTTFTISLPLIYNEASQSTIA
jgi:two-component system phosphate regulon sensor histidine kinase PhoR